MITAEAMVPPQGRIEKSLFPGDATATDLADRLNGYITEGYAKAVDLGGPGTPAADAAALAWAYWRAFDAVWIRLSSSPINVALTDQGSRSYSSKQIDSFRELADNALAQFYAQFEESPTTGVVVQTSDAVPTHITW